MLFIKSAGSPPAIFFAIKNLFYVYHVKQSSQPRVYTLTAVAAFVNSVSFILFRPAAILSWFSAWKSVEEKRSLKAKVS